MSLKTFVKKANNFFGLRSHLTIAAEIKEWMIRDNKILSNPQSGSPNNLQNRVIKSTINKI